MAAQVESHDTKSMPLNQLEEHGDSYPPLPAYEADPNSDLPAVSPSTSTSSLPQYEDVAGSSASPSGFTPTLSLQVENRGVAMVALPLPPRPVPIDVYAVNQDGTLGALAYQSVRQERSSGNSTLHRGTGNRELLSTSTYRFGPGRPPKIQLCGVEGQQHLAGFNEELAVEGNSPRTRAARIRTHLGTFSWRYASKAERGEVGGGNVHSLLVLDRITTVELEGGKTGEQARRVAQLVRDDEFRTAGSSKRSAGNGGRLMMDLREWSGGKVEAAWMEVFVVTSLLVMLKREVDRRRAVQFAVIMGGGGGGA